MKLKQISKKDLSYSRQVFMHNLLNISPSIAGEITSDKAFHSVRTKAISICEQKLFSFCGNLFVL